MPDSKRDVRASRVLARLRHLAALPEPRRTRALVAFAKRACRRSLIALVNALHVDRYRSDQHWRPVDPRGESPEWAVDLPIEFFGVIASRLWPAEFVIARALGRRATTKTVGQRVKLLAWRWRQGLSLWNAGDVSAWQPDRERHGLRREQSGRSPRPSQRTERGIGRIGILTVPVLGQCKEPSDAELIHDFLANVVLSSTLSTTDDLLACSTCDDREPKDAMAICSRCQRIRCPRCVTLAEARAGRCGECEVRSDDG